MKKNLNVKNIKTTMKQIYLDCLEIDDFSEYIEIFDSFRMMRCLGFLTYDEWDKIWKYDSELSSIEKSMLVGDCTWLNEI